MRTAGCPAVRGGPYGLQAPFSVGVPILVLVGLVVAVAVDRDPRSHEPPRSVPEATP